MAEIHQDFEDMLRCLNTAKVKYLIVGAHAVSVYTEPRYTKDIDIWVEPTKENAVKVYNALKKFGAPIKQLEVDDLANPNLVYQMGVAPVRIDILMSISGTDFPTAWSNKKTIRFGKEKVHVIGFEELVKAKKASGRTQDELDLEKLYRVKEIKLGSR